MRTISAVSFLLFLLFSSHSGFADERHATILFDQGHNQRFIIEKKGDLHLSKLAETMMNTGAQVTSTHLPLSDETLKSATALVISGPFKSLQPEEVEAVARFIEKGGRIAVMLHIGPPLVGLLQKLDLDHSNFAIHERANVIDNDINFRVDKLASSPLFSGITQFSVYGCWALDQGRTGIKLAQSSPQAWVDLNGDKVLSAGDSVGEFTVAVSGKYGAGSYVVFGDDAMFQNRFLDENNSKLAANLALWLTGR
ncbi:MAG TPA: DUF4350 domain-containing protein [Desulfuromonadales bacterium]|nr:DUF4350 domain-containing protein [Desulfuromonadales bacterium]